MSTRPTNLPADDEQPRHARSIGSSADRVLMIVNRKAGAGRRRAVVEQVVDRLSTLGMTTTVLSDLAEFSDIAHAATDAGTLRGVVSAGGDGTISAALNATPAGTPLAILPMGTENLLARYLRHRQSADSIAQLMTEGVVAPLDAATAGDRLFAIVLSAGLDAEVVRRVHEHRKGNITHLAYAGPLLQTVGGYRFPKVTVTSVDPDGQSLSTTGCWTFAVNLPCYALGLPLAPHAVGTDGHLDLCQLERGSLTAGLWYLWHVLRRQHHMLDSVHTGRSAKFLIESADGHEIPFQVDGDPGGVLPVEVASLPGRMQLIVSTAVAARLGFAPDAKRD
jgi:diacylglycerol kinase (ATP)